MQKNVTLLYHLSYQSFFLFIKIGGHTAKSVGKIRKQEQTMINIMLAIQKSLYKNILHYFQNVKSESSSQMMDKTFMFQHINL